MDPRRSAPHVARNTAPIVDVLRGFLPAEGLVLEVASGSGEHALAFARAFPHLLWQPTDADPVGLRSIDAWRAADGVPNLMAPIHLDASADSWPVEKAQAILCINMVHISPWAATEGLMALAGQALAPGGLLALYGPYLEADVPLAPSNAAFDESLKSRDPAWGLRDRDAVAAAAKAEGLALTLRAAMPANNLMLLFRRV